MCAKMRRGALHNAMKERGITKIALGHHYDDAVETFFMSLIFEGRLSCFQPVTWLDRTGITQIRPLLYCGEQMVRHTAQRLTPARGGKPLPRQRQHQAPGDQGADLRAQRPLPRSESPEPLGPCSVCPCPPGVRWSTADGLCPRNRRIFSKNDRRKFPFLLESRKTGCYNVTERGTIL